METIERRQSFFYIGEDFKLEKMGVSFFFIAQQMGMAFSSSPVMVKKAENLFIERRRSLLVHDMRSLLDLDMTNIR